MTIPAEIEQVVRNLNPWWEDAREVRPPPPEYRRRSVRKIGARLMKKGALIEILRGPRQVGKTTGLQQIIEDLLRGGTQAREILFVRFDLENLREIPNGLLAILSWYSEHILGRKLGTGASPYVFLDEIHKIPRWDEQVKHIYDTFRPKMILTGSSSVLVARGGRESLAGRVFSTEIPTFLFREVLEAWRADLAAPLPPPVRFNDIFEPQARGIFEEIQNHRGRKKPALMRALDRYYSRGGYPRLHSGEVDDDHWADYLVQTVFENVLGTDIPALFPVDDPKLLRHLYLSVARLTGREISQASLAEEANTAGMRTSHPTVGKYLRFLGDALLLREFRRYPMGKRRSARVPSKIVLADLGIRNAIMRGSPSLWESDPALVGPLVETLVQAVVRDHNLQVHFWRDYERKGNRKSPLREVDFVAERIDGTVLPIEVKFRKRIDSQDSRGLRVFLERHEAPYGILVTRDTYNWDPTSRILSVPLLDFLLAF